MPAPYSTLHQCVRVIYAYMGLAGFSIFFVLTGIIALELLQKWDVHTDFISFTYILYNFAVSHGGAGGYHRCAACCRSTEHTERSEHDMCPPIHCVMVPACLRSPPN